jgi:hypothetical protein
MDDRNEIKKPVEQGEMSLAENFKNLLPYLLRRKQIINTDRFLGLSGRIF